MREEALEIQKAVEQEIQRILNGLFEDTPGELKDVIIEFSHFVLRPGKRIRPFLLVLTYNGYSDNDAENNALKLAAVIEIMHAFLLVHDDVIDESLLRRGEPTLHKIYESKFENEKLGKDLAIIVGDIISFYLLGVLSELNIEGRTFKKVLKLFSDCYVKTGYGQLLDILYTGRLDETILTDDIPAKISLLKTAYYTFIHPMLFGYYLSGRNDEKEIKTLTEIGKLVGIAFQYRDDIIGTFGGDKKSVNDIVEGKATILIKKTAEKLSSEKKMTLFDIISKKEKTQEEIELIQSLILESGALTETVNEINILVLKALDLLEELFMKERSKEEIKRILNKILEIPQIGEVRNGGEISG